VAIAILSVPHRVAAAEWWPGLDEFRLGAAASTNDHPVSGYAQIEALFSPFPARAAYDPNLAWLFSPRPLVGASISLRGKTNEAFAGLAWQAPLASGLFLEMSFGGLVHDQKLFEIYPDRPRLTTRFLFRESIAVGYDIDPRWRIIAFADHGSNGNLGYANRSINHVGMMLSAKFGEPVRQFAAPEPASMASFSWAGPYGGFSGGTAHASSKVVINDPAAATETTSGSASSLIAGGHLGYNWTAGSLVTGIESDISAQQPSVSATQSTLHPEEVSVASRWIATARARVGIDLEQIDFYRLQRMLVYATGGAAFTRIEKSYCNHATDPCYVNGEVAGGWSAADGNRIGWTVGGGVAIPLAANASAKIEYLFANFGKFSFSNGRIGNDVTFFEQILRAGISFGFAGG
jgi:outer membrane immunogenic protein